MSGVTRRRAASIALLWLCALGCEQRGDKAQHGRSDAVSSASQEMSGPSLFSRERLRPALDAVRAKAGGKLLRLEIHARELTLQAEDASTPGSVIELHYQGGKISEPEHATLRGKGQLAENVFDLGEVRLDAIPELTREAVRRIDPEAGNVDYVLVRRNFPDTDDVRLRVYVSSPRQSGYVEADHTGQIL
jgi:hypothetical protein